MTDFGLPKIHVAVDCTVCPPLADRTNSPYYSGKHKLHCVKYEAAVASNGLICSLVGPVPGRIHDLTLFRAELINRLDTGEKVLADKAYQGEGDSCVTPFRGKDLTPNQDQFNTALGRKRIVVEHAFGKMKVFKALTTPWRHELERHKKIANIVANIVNLKIKLG